MTHLFDTALFFQVVARLHQVLKQERECLMSKDFNPLSSLWKEKEELLTVYEKQSLRWQQNPHILEEDREKFIQVNQELLEDARANEVYLKQLRDLSDSIVMIMRKAASRTEESEGYTPKGLLREKMPQQSLPLKASYYL